VSDSALDRHRFAAYYGLSVAIAVGVMAAGPFLPPGAAATLLPDLWKFLREHGLYPNIISIGRFAATSRPAGWLILVFAAAPTLAALAVAALTGRLRDLLSRLEPWRGGVGRGEGIAIYSTLFALYAAYAGAFLAATALRGNPGELAHSLDLLGGSPAAAAGTLFLGLFLDEGGTLEELGWRGFALPRLNERMSSPLVAALSLGALWWAWHLPREIPEVAAAGLTSTWASGQALFLLLCLVETVVIAYLCNRTGGSVWPGVLVHGGTNAIQKSIGAPVDRMTGPIDVRTAVLALAAVVIVVIAGRGLGARRWKASAIQANVSPASRR
jgi:membrane protease YdiL (CAAX protease family)